MSFFRGEWITAFFTGSEKICILKKVLDKEIMDLNSLKAFNVVGEITAMILLSKKYSSEDRGLLYL
jgi:hypothetical protein